MGILSFAPPDICPPNDQFQAIKLTPSYPVVISGYYSWDAAVRRAIDILYSVDASDMEVGSPETAVKLFDLAQILEDLCMHNYSHTVATWALQLRRGLYHSDKDMHRRDLASALSLKARTLARVGKIDGAIIAARGAVQLCYEDQALQGGQLAKALQVHATLLSAAGKKSEAKAVAMETVEVLRALGEDKPHLKHFLSLARASISDILVDMEEYDEALTMAHAAIKSARTLIGVVDSRPALTIALLVRARTLSARGEKASAYVAGVQAVRYLRDLASERPTFTTFLAHVLLHSSRYLHAAGFYWEARKHAEESVELYRTLHASAPQAFVRQYAEAVGYVVQLRAANDNVGREVFDMAQHARDLFREASIHDSITLAVILGMIASSLLEVGRLQEAAAPAMEAVGIFKDRWTHDPDRYASPLVGALRLASSCLPGTEDGLEYAKEAVEVHRERKDLERGDHDGVLTHLLMEVFSRLRELGREVEAIPWKTEAAKLNGDIVESSDGPEAEFKGLPDGILEYPLGSDDGDDDDDDIKDI
jgi:tetratricopeptide (TPR) repeat protein